MEEEDRRKKDGLGRKMAKLIINANKQYIKRMYIHLKKEHPSTRQRMQIRFGKNMRK